MGCKHQYNPKGADDYMYDDDYEDLASLGMFCNSLGLRGKFSLFILEPSDVATDMWYAGELITSNAMFSMLGVLGWISMIIAIAASIGFVFKVFFLRNVICI